MKVPVSLAELNDPARTEVVRLAVNAVLNIVNAHPRPHQLVLMTCGTLARMLADRMVRGDLESVCNTIQTLAEMAGYDPEEGHPYGTVKP